MAEGLATKEPGTVASRSRFTQRAIAGAQEHPTMKITVSTIVDAPIHEVWRAYTTPEDIKVWNAASPDGTPPRRRSTSGRAGTFSSRMEAKDGSFGFDFAGQYTRVEPPGHRVRVRRARRGRRVRKSGRRP